MDIAIPYLHDHHTHPLLYASFLTAVDLSGVKCVEEASDLINERHSRTEVVVAHSWKDNFFQFSEASLGKLPPVAIFNLSLHKLVLNQSGREVLKRKFGGAVERVSDQNWYERNLRQVLNWFALLNGSSEALATFYEVLLTLGIRSAEEMLLVDPCEIDWYKEADLAERTKFWASPASFQALSDDQRADVTGLKLFTDGALGSRTAAVSVAYDGEPKNFGMLMYDDAELERLIAEGSQMVEAMAIHAIGDRAIEQTLSALEAIGPARRPRTIRIEHAQLITRSQARRAKSIDVILSMQPNFNVDSVDYRDRLSAELCEGNNPFRMLIDEVGFEPGDDLILGSDGMPHGAAFALNQSLNPSVANQKLTLEEFKRGYGAQGDATFNVALSSTSE